MSERRKIWGWYFFDWATQPYNTLMLTFVFGPYFAQTAANHFVVNGMREADAAAMAQAWWGYGLMISGIIIAILAPILGSIADGSRRRIPWIWFFSLLYFIGAFGTWWSAPDMFNPVMILLFFGIGLIGMEFATIFSNALLPSLGDRKQWGIFSGTGWAFGYVGGVIALIIMLFFFQAGTNGKTFIGLSPLFDLDVATKADTRFVGPFTALWFFIFMIPFFFWIKEDRSQNRINYGDVQKGLHSLLKTLKNLRSNSSFLAYLGSSMFYRDGLNGMYAFGGIYAVGVLEWSIIEIGTFGIAGAISGAVFCWIGGYVDQAIGPRPVIAFNCLVLILVAVVIVSLTKDSVFGIKLAEGSGLSNQLFFLTGILIGASGGVLQSSSRHMLTRQGDSERMTEAFGLYAMTGKATAFLAPASIAIVTNITSSQRLGISPIIVLFVIGLILLLWVKPEGTQIQ
ncbi:MAG: MFS transporter [Aestuariivita sp.]|nr:MFS transporter [Aestuariivita sp.]